MPFREGIKTGLTRRRIGGVSAFGDKNVAVDAEDPENAYGQLVDSLVYAVTPDFRASWIRVGKGRWVLHSRSFDPG